MFGKSVINFVCGYRLRSVFVLHVFISAYMVMSFGPTYIIMSDSMLGFFTCPCVPPPSVCARARVCVCVCVCVCVYSAYVCVCERDRQTDRQRQRD